MAELLPSDYISGFVDGEGCFALKFRKDACHGRPTYFRWDIEFAIHLKEDDKEILESIQKTFGCGRMSYPKGAARYAVNDVIHLQGIIVPFFELHKLHAKKRFDFELWKEGVAIFVQNRRKKFNQKDLDRLLEIKTLMEKYKGGNRHNWKWLKKV